MARKKTIANLSAYKKAYSAVNNSFLRKIKKELNVSVEAFKKASDYLPKEYLEKSVKTFRKNKINELRKTTRSKFLNFSYADQIKIIRNLNDKPERLETIYKKYTRKEVKATFIKNIEYVLNQLPWVSKSRVNKIVEKIKGLSSEKLKSINGDIEALFIQYRDDNYSDAVEIILQTIEAL